MGGTYSEHMSVESLPLLKRRLARIERRHKPASVALRHAPTGYAPLDRALGGGLIRGRVHELQVTEPGESGSGAGFAGVLAQRLGGELLWLREEAAERGMGQLHAAGLAQIGFDPARLILGVLPDPAAVLRCAADAIRCPALGAVVIELWGDPRPLDLTATRRLALAAEGSGVTALLLRIAGHEAPSAAQTRIAVAPVPSQPLPANAPGHPAWRIELLRQRGRPDGGVWRVEWDRANGVLREQEHGETISGAVVPLSADRSAGALRSN
jgi:protein ImuA